MFLKCLIWFKTKKDKNQGDLNALMVKGKRLTIKDTYMSLKCLKWFKK